VAALALVLVEAGAGDEVLVGGGDGRADRHLSRDAGAEREMGDACLKREGLVGGRDRRMAECEIEADGERKQQESGEKAEES
jgi:hypothetical protein